MARHALSALLWVVLGAGAALGQTTAFTYQGQLTDAGQAANGSFDLQFGLFGNASGGTQIGSTQTVSMVPVSNGVFTVQLDFGVSAFPGANRFLEISVRPAGGGRYTTLAPRQQISSTPYAIRTLSAATADTLSSACVGCVTDSQINTVAGSKVSGPIPAASLPAGSGNYIQNTTTPQGSANFNVSGNGVVGGNLTVAGTLTANVSGNFIQNRSTPQTNTNFNISGNGTLGGTLSAANAGIGTAAPNHRLRISGGPLWTADGWLGEMELDNIGAIGWHANATGNRFGLGQTNGGLQFFATGSDPGTITSPVNYLLTFADNANVGIGTTTPTSKLEIAAQDGLAITGFQPFLTLRDTNAANARGLIASGGGDISIYPDSSIGGAAAMTIKNVSGNVGIGTTSPTGGKLHVSSGSGNGVYGASTGAGAIGVFGESTLFEGVRGVSRGAAAGGVVGYNVNGGVGVYGQSDAGIGMQARSTNATGVDGGSTNGIGVYGVSVNGYAMYANGNAGQARDKGGWVKAMLVVNADGTIARCYNGMINSSVGNCGFTINHSGPGRYSVGFGFQVDDRFASVTPHQEPDNIKAKNVSAMIAGYTGSGIAVLIFYTDNGDPSGWTNDPFTIIVF